MNDSFCSTCMRLHLEYRIPLAEVGELWLWLNYLDINFLYHINSSKDKLIDKPAMWPSGGGETTGCKE